QVADLPGQGRSFLEPTFQQAGFRGHGSPLAALPLWPIGSLQRQDDTENEKQTPAAMFRHGMSPNRREVRGGPCRAGEEPMVSPATCGRKQLLECNARWRQGQGGSV